MTGLAPISILAVLALFVVPVNPASAGVTASFRHPLSNFSGPVPSQWAKLAVDRERDEIFVLNPHENDVRIFDDHGMETYVFGEDFPGAADIALGEGGDIFILTRRYPVSRIHLCNFRGEQTSEITLDELPAAFSDFTPDRLVYRHGSLYLADSGRLVVVVTDVDGSFEKAYDLKAIVKSVSDQDDRTQKELEEIGINGFDVDPQGNLLFTVPTLFSAFRLSTDGQLTAFGRPGSAPGKFGVAAGIVADDLGYIYVSDRLRSAVLVFDHNLTFQTEFGYRGGRPSNLIVPDDLAIDGKGNLYVAQAANRGVSVFGIVYERATELAAKWDERLSSQDTTKRGSQSGENAETENE